MDSWVLWFRVIEVRGWSEDDGRRLKYLGVLAPTDGGATGNITLEWEEGMQGFRLGEQVKVTLEPQIGSG